MFNYLLEDLINNIFKYQPIEFLKYIEQKELKLFFNKFEYFSNKIKNNLIKYFSKNINLKMWNWEKTWKFISNNKNVEKYQYPKYYDNIWKNIIINFFKNNLIKMNGGTFILKNQKINFIQNNMYEYDSIYNEKNKLFHSLFTDKIKDLQHSYNSLIILNNNNYVRVCFTQFKELYDDCGDTADGGVFVINSNIHKFCEAIKQMNCNEYVAIILLNNNDVMTFMYYSKKWEKNKYLSSMNIQNIFCYKFGIGYEIIIVLKNNYLLLHTSRCEKLKFDNLKKIKINDNIKIHKIVQSYSHIIILANNGNLYQTKKEFTIVKHKQQEKYVKFKKIKFNFKIIDVWTFFKSVFVLQKNGNILTTKNLHECGWKKSN